MAKKKEKAKQTLSPPGIDKEGKRIRFDYIKGNYFRVIHVDGVHGGPNPNPNYIGMSLFSSRWPIPRQTTYALKKDGTLGNELLNERLNRDAIVREIEAEVIMDINTARTMHKWLGDKIKAVDQFTKNIEEKKGKK